MSEQSRKVLEEIQKAKSNLLKQGPAVVLGLGFASPAVGGAPPNHFSGQQPSSPGVGFGEVHMSPAQRSAMQSLHHANASSFGFFITQESLFGNSILPVLPRFDSPITKPN